MAKQQGIRAITDKDGRITSYQWRYTYKGKTYSGTEKTQRAALDARIACQLEKRGKADVKGLTLQGYFETIWEDGPHSRSLYHRTKYSYQNMFRREISPTFGNRQIDDVPTRSEFQRWIDGISEGSRSTAAKTLRAIWRSAADEGYLGPNISGGDIFNYRIKSNYHKPPTETWTESELSIMCGRFFQHWGEPRCRGLEAFFMLAFGAGLRKEEVSALRWEDLHFKDGGKRCDFFIDKIKLPTSTTTEARTKNEQSVRPVSITSPFADALYLYRRAGGPIVPAMYTRDIGDEMTGGGIQRRWKSLWDDGNLFHSSSLPVSYHPAKSLRAGHISLCERYRLPVGPRHKYHGHRDGSIEAQFYTSWTYDDAFQFSLEFSEYFVRNPKIRAAFPADFLEVPQPEIEIYERSRDERDKDK